MVEVRKSRQVERTFLPPCRTRHRRTNDERGVGSGHSRGFALIIVLWGLVVIGLLITHLTAMGRTEAKIAANMISNAQARAAADGGVAMALFHLSQTDAQSRWLADGSPHQVQIGSFSVSVRSVDELGKVNPNLASEALMSALLQASGVEASRAAGLALAISCWHDLVRQSKPGGIGPNDYAAAGLDYSPPGSAFEKIDELGRVLGMTQPILSALRPHLSLWNRLDVPLRTAADPVVVQAIDQVSSKRNTTLALPPQSQRLTVSIEAISRASSGASFTRHAVVQVGPGLRNGYQVLAWDREN